MFNNFCRALLGVSILTVSCAYAAEPVLTGENVEAVASYAAEKAAKSVDAKKNKLLGKAVSYASEEALKNVKSKKNEIVEKAVSFYNSKKHANLKKQVCESTMDDELKALLLDTMDELKSKKEQQKQAE